MLLISLFQVHTCTTKLLEIETALRCVSVCVCVFFLLFIKLVSNTALSCVIIIAGDPALRRALAGGGGGGRGGTGKGRRGCNYVSGI